MARWVEVTLLHSGESALVNADLVQFARTSPRDDKATELVFAAEDSVDIKESFDRVRNTLKS